jgi:signal peptidase I
MASLDQALLNQQRPEANERARRLEQFAKEHCKKSIFDYAKELFFALIFALAIASVVRAMWFEPYEIPTGSMRPTFKEQDHLTVTKTAFGINVPFKTEHFYFDPDLVQRTSILIFSGDGLPLRDTDTTYFGIFPYKKRYIKRAIGKPGDTFYFYGGQLYGIDKDGNEIKELRDTPWMKPLEHIPFLAFEGDMTAGGSNRILFNHFHRPFGRLAIGPDGQIKSDIFTGKEWIKDNPTAQKSSHSNIETYSDFLGMRNYAEARLLTKEQLQQLPNIEGLEEGLLYLQLHHTPSLSYPKPQIQREGGGVSIGIPAYSTIIPLQKEHLDALMDNMYTARFVVADGKARRYSLGDEQFVSGSPSYAGVPDGTYEFYQGKASKINWGGIETTVDKDSELYSRDPKNIQKLYNLGIEMNTAFNPSAKNQTLFPHRYVYFRDGDLYAMGGVIMKKDDPTLKKFLEREKKREQQATPKAPYVAFQDYGPPMKDGKIDADFIKTFGITVPEKTYMMLGDNHAMSADSRIFGFVPEANLQGAPYWIVWPPGDRLGPPSQKPYPFMNIPRAIIWSIAALIAIIWFIYHRWRIRRPIFIKKTP